MGLHAIWLSCACEQLSGDAAMENTTILLDPLKLAVMMIHPEADDVAVAVKAALMDPCGTVTVGGTWRLKLLLDKFTAMLPANLDVVTVHWLLELGVIAVGMQVANDNTGVDHSVKVTLCEDVPRVAVTDPVASARMLPILALKAPEALPAPIAKLPGMVIRAEVELNPMGVDAEAGCDNVTVHELIAPLITPVGLQTSEEIVTEVAAWKLAVNEVGPLNVTVVEALPAFATDAPVQVWKVKPLLAEALIGTGVPAA